MDPAHLELDEVMYELKIRGIIGITGGHRRCSAILRQRLESEMTLQKQNAEIPAPTDTNLQEELLECERKCVQLKEMCSTPNALKSKDFVLIMGSRIVHLSKRIRRLTGDDPQTVSRIESLAAQIEVLVQVFTKCANSVPNPPQKVQVNSNQLNRGCWSEGAKRSLSQSFRSKGPIPVDTNNSTAFNRYGRPKNDPYYLGYHQSQNEPNTQQNQISRLNGNAIPFTPNPTINQLNDNINVDSQRSSILATQITNFDQNHTNFPQTSHNVAPHHSDLNNRIPIDQLNNNININSQRPSILGTPITNFNQNHEIFPQINRNDAPYHRNDLNNRIPVNQLNSNINVNSQRPSILLTPISNVNQNHTNFPQTNHNEAPFHHNDSNNRIPVNQNYDNRDDRQQFLPPRQNSMNYNQTVPTFITNNNHQNRVVNASQIPYGATEPSHSGFIIPSNTTYMARPAISSQNSRRHLFGTTQNQNPFVPPARHFARVQQSNNNRQLDRDDFEVNSPNQNPNRRRICSVAQWGISFSGDEREISLNDFLSQVELYARAEKITEEELLSSAIYLFKGTAKTWYRAFHSYFDNWLSLVNALRDQFLPHDYDYWLYKEIEQRRQDESEDFGIFLATMEMLFRNLSVPLYEEEKLDIVMRNMLPIYADKIDIDSVYSLYELKTKCKNIERNRFRLNRRFIPTIPRRDLLEPAFAPPYRQRVSEVEIATDSISTNEFSSNSNYVDAVTSNSSNRQEQARILCFNCGNHGHHFNYCSSPKNKFCYTCGYKNVTINNCPKCHQHSGNGSAGQQRGAMGGPQNTTGAPRKVDKSTQSTI